MLESSIPSHLQCKRNLPRNAPEGYAPQFPLYSARFSENMTELVMMIIGAQFPSPSDEVAAAVSEIMSFVNIGMTDSTFSEPVSVSDAAGFYNVAVIAYWPDKTAYNEWVTKSKFQDWWEKLDAETSNHGWFREVFFPPTERFETLFSNPEMPEGAGNLRESMSDGVQEHGYWGSMRDRLPISQTDRLTGDRAAMGPLLKEPVVHKRRITVPGKKNLCVIRSGQNWQQANPKERKLYLETMHPVLVKGMEFLRDHGEEVGCYSCRLMDVINSHTLKADQDTTFGLAYFDDIASLENWSREHPTHLAIFGRFSQYCKQLEDKSSLALFHEVLVLEPEQQIFEYIGCHSQSGMLRSLA